MKKILLASTALVFTAGFAAADVTLGGSANMGVKYIEGAADELQLFYELDFGINGSGTTDGGLTFGASIDLDATIVPATGQQNSVPGAQEDFDPEVFISGAFGTLTVGNLDDAADPFGIADIGFDGIGVDDDAESLKGALTTTNVNYAYSFGDIDFLLGLHTVQEDFSVSVSYDPGTFNVAISYAEDNQTGLGTISVFGGATFGAISVNALYSDWDGGASAYGLDASYDLGAYTITAAFGDTDGAGDVEDFGVGVSYGLGGGATLAGGIGSVDDNLVADFGINLSF